MQWSVFLHRQALEDAGELCILNKSSVTCSLLFFNPGQSVRQQQGLGMEGEGELHCCK